MISWFYFIAFLLALYMFVSFLVNNKKVDSLLILFALMVVINCAGYYFLSISRTLEMAIFSNKFLYMGGCFAPLFTVLLLYRLCKIRIPKLLVFFLSVFSSLVFALVLTIGRWQIYYKYIELIRENGYSYLTKEYGPTHILYPIMLVTYGLVILYCLIYANKKRKDVSLKVILIIGATGVAVISMYIVEQLLNLNIALAPLGYIFGLGLISKYYARINMYDLSSNISVSMEKMKDYAYLIFDHKYRFFHANELAKELFPEIKTWIIDQVVPASDSYLYQAVIKYLMDWEDKDSGDRTINVGKSFLKLHIRTISYGRKENVGYLLELTDCTSEQTYFSMMEEYNISMEQEIAAKTSELLKQQQQTNKLFLQTVIALSEAVDAKDRYTSGHSRRVAEYSRKIAARMGKSEELLDDIYYTGLLHDVGKIRVPVDIINKPGKLTDEEFNIIKIHPVTGYHILRSISESSSIAIAAKYHHERYDGKGYPNGLSGTNIPEIARILCVADSYDAMTSNRSYRKALSQDVVRGELEKGKGTQFDPEIADIMIQLIDEDTHYLMRQTDSLNHHVLIVDDDAMNHKIISHIMQEEPEYKLFFTGSGIDALERMKVHSYDLILLDVQMADMDGLETLKRIREFSNVPVVLMTGNKTLNTSSDFAKLGCDDYITKPFVPILLREVIHNMTKKSNT
ncbi:MAG: response regulator [Lachnospiraceae bacterium]|nr:response regulator [Lachnospiraceae bacterium]